MTEFTLEWHVDYMRRHYAELEELTGGLEGQVADEAHYVNEMSNEPSVFDLERNQADVEGIITDLIDALKSNDKEKRNYHTRKRKAVDLRALSQLIMLRESLKALESE